MGAILLMLLAWQSFHAEEWERMSDPEKLMHVAARSRETRLSELKREMMLLDRSDGGERAEAIRLAKLHRQLTANVYTPRPFVDRSIGDHRDTVGVSHGYLRNPLRVRDVDENGVVIGVATTPLGSVTIAISGVAKKPTAGKQVVIRHAIRESGTWNHDGKELPMFSVIPDKEVRALLRKRRVPPFEPLAIESKQLQN